MVDSDPVESRLDAIEARISRLEAQLESARAPVRSPIGEAAPESPTTRPSGERPPVVEPPGMPGSLPEPARRDLGVSISTVLGWAGAGALLLAAAYFIRLAIGEGWLTPWLQIGVAAAAGVAMIAAGLLVRSRDSRYASLLGAGGVAVLFLTTYGAHVHHHLIGPGPAIAATAVVAAVSLLLHAGFRHTLYLALALSGTYSAPLLLPRGTIEELCLYLGIWNVVFVGYAVWRRSRGLCLATLCASLLVFAWGWERALDAYLLAAQPPQRLDYHALPRAFAGAFLWSQALLFLAATPVVAARSRSRQAAAWALAHSPALLVWYMIQYGILGGEFVIVREDRADVAAWSGIALALATYATWRVARARGGEPDRAWIEVAHAFAGVVFLHAVYWELVPALWRPWVAVAMVALVLGLRRAGVFAWVWAIVAALVFLAGYLELWLAWPTPGSVAPHPSVPGRQALSLIYPAILYALHFSIAPGADPRTERVVARWLALVSAHAMTLGAAVWLVREWLGSPDTTIERLWLSLAWAGIGLAWLAIATARGDRGVATSTLGIFAAFALKVVFFDLDHAGPLVRVGILVVLGLTLYVGGWIYRRVVAPTT